VRLKGYLVPPFTPTLHHTEYPNPNFKPQLYMTLLTLAQIIISIILVVLILLQEQSGETSGIFGGAGGGGGFYQRKRGWERGLFMATVILAILFAILGILNLVSPDFTNIF